jgi:hypothetical protein
MGNTPGPNTSLLLVRVRLIGVVFENLVMLVTSSFPQAWRDATSYRGVGPMKKLLILAVLALTIIGGTAAIEMLVSHLAD